MNPKVLLVTIPSDSHTWNLIYLQLLLQENGFDVINLGACTSFEESENACIKVNPELVVVSTVNGHGYIEGVELVTRLRALPCMQNVDIYIGGKLNTDKKTYAMELEMSGYTKVYHEGGDSQDFILRLHRLKRAMLLQH